MAYTWIANWNDAPRWPELGLSGLGLVRTLEPGDVQRAQKAAASKGRRPPSASGGDPIGQREEGTWSAPSTGQGMGPCPAGTVPYKGTCAPTQTGAGGGVTQTGAGGGVTQAPAASCPPGTTLYNGMCITTSSGGGMTQGPSPVAPGGGQTSASRRDGRSRLDQGGGRPPGPGVRLVPGGSQQSYAPLPPIPTVSTGGATPAPPPPAPPTLLPGGSGGGSPYASLAPRLPNPFATSAGSPSRRYPNGTTPRGAYLFPDMRLARRAHEAQPSQTIVQQSVVHAAAPPAPGVASPYASPGGSLPQPLLTTPTAAAQAEEAGIETLRAIARGQQLAVPAPSSGPGAFWVVAGILVAGGLVWAATRE